MSNSTPARSSPSGLLETIRPRAQQKALVLLSIDPTSSKNSNSCLRTSRIKAVDDAKKNEKAAKKKRERT